MKNNKEIHLPHEHTSFFFFSPAIIWQVLFFCIPLLFIMSLGFVRPTETGFAFSFANYTALFTTVSVMVISRSFLLAFVTTIICLLIAYPVTYYLVFCTDRWRYLLVFFLILPFFISLLVLTYSWFFILDRYGMINTLLLKLGLIDTPLLLFNNYFSIYLTMVYCYLPFMLLPLYSTLEQLDVRLIEASRDLGAGALWTFFHLIVPLSLSGIRTGCLFVFVPAFGEFVIPMLVGGAKNFFVGSLISHFFLVSRDPFVGSAFTGLSGLMLAIFVIFLYQFFGALGTRKR